MGVLTGGDAVERSHCKSVYKVVILKHESIPALPKDAQETMGLYEFVKF